MLESKNEGLRAKVTELQRLKDQLLERLTGHTIHCHAFSVPYPCSDTPPAPPYPATSTSPSPFPSACSGASVGPELTVLQQHPVIP